MDKNTHTTSPYRVPQGGSQGQGGSNGDYFTDLKSRILAQTADKEVSPKNPAFIGIRWRSLAAVAACLILLIGVGYGTMGLVSKHSQTTKTATQTSANLFAEAVLDYVDLYGIEEDTIIDTQ